MPNFKRIGGGPWKNGQKSDDLTWNDPHVPGCCLGDGPDFEALVDGLSRQVLLHKWASIEGDHFLVDRQLSPRTVPPRKLRRRRWQQWPDLVKMIVSCVTSSSCRAVVISLKILHQLLEVMLGHDFHHARHPKHVVWRPLLYFFWLPNHWQMF